MKFHSPAKINLTLDILKKDINYHELKTVYLEYPAVYDEIEITPIKTGISLEVLELYESGGHKLKVSRDERNLAYQAAALVLKNKNIKEGIKIKLIKKISPGSGLGAASSNAAAVLKALNLLWKLNLNAEELRNLAGNISMDASFFIEGGIALGEHYGEKITQISDKFNLIHSLRDKIKIIFTGIPVETKQAYKNLNPAGWAKNTKKTDKLIKGVKEGDLELIFKNIHNDFEDSIYRQFPEIKLKKENLEKSFRKVCLSGSGGCLFAVD